MLRVTDVRLVGPFRLWLAFNDGTEGEVDLERELDGPVFAIRREPGAFAQVELDPEIRTIAWPNGADFAPEFLWKRVRNPVVAYGSAGEDRYLQIVAELTPSA